MHHNPLTHRITLFTAQPHLLAMGICWDYHTYDDNPWYYRGVELLQ